MYLLIQLMWMWTLPIFKVTFGNVIASCERYDMDYEVSLNVIEGNEVRKLCSSSQIQCLNHTIGLNLANNFNCSNDKCYKLTITNSNLSSVGSTLLSSMCGTLFEINLSNCEINTISQDAFLKFSIMQHLALDRNKIETLEFLESAKSVTILSLKYNELTELHADLFRFLQNLTILNVAHNKLKLLGSRPYQLDDLEEFYLNNNKIVTIESNVFQVLKKLRILNLADNQIVELPNVFHNLTDLQELFLQNNDITNISPSLFHGLSRLGTLDLGNNSFFSEISNKTFSNLNNLISLNLSHNNLSTIAPNSFLGLSHLETLNLTNNKVHTLSPNSFYGLANLKELVLTDNRIKDFSFYAFRGLPSLLGLQLRNNCLSEFKMNAISNLRSLQYLDLSHNKIEMLDQSMVHPLDKLQSLNLSNNMLSFINYSVILHYYPSLKNIILRNNDWNCHFLRNILDIFELLNINYLTMKDKSAAKERGGEIIPCRKESYSSEQYNLPGTPQHSSKGLSDPNNFIQKFDDNIARELVKLSLDVKITFNALFYLMLLVFIEMLFILAFIIYRKSKTMYKKMKTPELELIHCN